MKKYKSLFLILTGSLLMPVESYSCTSAIISAKASATGKPMLWKHRDTSSLQNRLARFQGEKYSFTGLVNSEDYKNESVWMGCNSEGFAIMNTASYNLKALNDTTQKADMEGVLMKKALSVCKSVDDFQHFLDTISKPMCVEANFGMIDAQGNGAYFEVNNYDYTKYDVNDSQVAPDGILIRTNYSFSGRENKGMGYIRYENALSQIKSAKGNITPEFLYGTLGRTYYHSLLEKNYTVNHKDVKWIVDQDYIPRHSTSSAMVIEGVNPGENLSGIVLWTVLGYPPVTPVYPVLMAHPDMLPELLTGNDRNPNSVVCDNALQLKKSVFPIERGSGQKYIDLDVLYAKGNAQIAVALNQLEEQIRRKYSSFAGTAKVPSKEETELFYKEINKLILDYYSASDTSLSKAD